MKINQLTFKLVIFLSVLTIAAVFNRSGDAIVHSQALNWRMGRMVKAQAVASYPELPLASLAVSLEPEDFRRGYLMKAAGQAKFYGPKKKIAIS